MKRFKNILVFFNKKYDQLALTSAFKLAKANKAKLTIMDIVEKSEQECQIINPHQKGPDTSVSPHCKAYLDNMAKPYQGHGVAVKTQFLHDIPIVRIIKEINKKNYDLVVTSTIGTKLRGFFWDSMALKLVRQSPVPVWIITSHAAKMPKHILAAIDLHKDAGTVNLNKSILEMSSALAMQNQGRLTVVHAWTAKSEVGQVHAHTALSGKEFQSLREQIKKSKMRKLQEIIMPYKKPGLTIHIRLMEKKPSLAIAETVKQAKVDIAVMGTVRRTGIAGFIMGSTAEETLPLLTSSLLALKPRGFQSSVR